MPINLTFQIKWTNSLKGMSPKWTQEQMVSLNICIADKSNA